MSESGSLSGDVIPRSQERAVNPLKLELQVAVSHLIWEPKSGPLEEQQVPFPAESSRQRQPSKLITG